MTTSAPTDLAGALQELGPDELTLRRVEARRLLRDDGVTYNVTRGPDLGTRAWEMDPLPVVITSDQWAPIDDGLAQRARVLDLLVTDLYGPRRLLREGLLPPEVIFAHPGFRRECDQARLPGEHQLLLTAADVGRDESGRHVVLADRTQAPSGAGYALENRIVVSRVFASLYRGAGVHRLAPFFRTLRTALQSVVPASVDQPRIVVLTPGPWSETAYEHAFTASYLGFSLVQGTDLQVRDGRVWMRTLGRPEPVHVILRRVDAEFCDPLELRPDSKLGVPGLVEACRLGNVSVVNTLGSGVLENPALLPFLPAICDALLGEPMRLPSVDTWWCGDDTSRQHVLGQIDRLVLKRTSSGSGTTVLMGAQLDEAARDELRRRIESEPHAWVGQEAVQLSSVPTSTDAGIELRRSVLRTFTVADGDGFSVLPGGLTLVAGRPDDQVISNQTGAISKDTWVLAEEPESLADFWLRSGPALDAVEPEASMSSRAAENLFWLSRYAERAEGLVRLLRVVEDRRTEFSHRPLDGGGGDACVAVLLGGLAATTGAPVVDSLPPLVVDVELAGSLAYSVRRMLDAATEVRDQLSIDTWLVIGGLDRALRAPGLDGSLDSASPALARVMQGLLALAGLSAESLVRDPGWHFLEAGRRIERAVHLCSLLTATVDERRDTATDSLVLESVLTASESIITYRRRYRSQAQLQTVLDLLLLDDHNPRSLVYQVERLVDAVGNLPAVGTSRSDAERRALDLAAAVHEIDTAQLAQSQPDRARPALREFLAATTRALAAIAASIERDHFTPELPQQAVFTPFTPNHPSRGVPLAGGGA
ncbi:MAG TPA: circularly permuted type 2 ATP-grasp protein [Microthrixaceae bacterium]|nr:circularly permuted type 2 ATP-grasp protein [Microthrixaceae bacterium]